MRYVFLIRSGIKKFWDFFCNPPADGSTVQHTRSLEATNFISQCAKRRRPVHQDPCNWCYVCSGQQVRRKSEREILHETGKKLLQKQTSCSRCSEEHHWKVMRDQRQLVHEDFRRTILNFAAVVGPSYHMEQSKHHSCDFNMCHVAVSCRKQHDLISASTLLARFGSSRLRSLPKDKDAS